MTMSANVDYVLAIARLHDATLPAGRADYFRNVRAYQPVRYGRSPQLAYALALRTISAEDDDGSVILRRMYDARGGWSNYSPTGWSKFIKVAEHITEVSVFACSSCSAPTWQTEWQSREYRGQYFCQECFEDRFTDCDECGNSEWRDDICYIDDQMICGTCRSRGDYFYCNHCCTWYGSRHNDYVQVDGGDMTACLSCAENHYHYCERCDEWYSRGHKHGCECEARHQTFTLNIAADGMLTNDTRHTVTIPGGMIDDDGFRKLQQIIADNNGPWQVLDEGFDMTWQTAGGNFPKRLSKALYKYSGFRASPELLAMVGNIGSSHVCKAADHLIELSRNLSPQDNWYHPTSSSCWWSDYAGSMCLFKASGGFGMRFFENAQTEDSNGRAWIMPLQRATKDIEKYDAGTATYQMVPTDTWAPCDDVNAKAYVVFNTYLARDRVRGSDRNKRYPARIMAQLTGLTYKSIGCEVNHGRMYLNGDAYLIADSATCKVTNSLALTVEAEECNA